MQLSFTATGTPTEVIASVDAQIAKEKGRISAQHQRDRKHVTAVAADAHAPLEAAVDTALAGVAVFVRADLEDAPADEQVSVSFTLTTHRPDR